MRPNALKSVDEGCLLSDVRSAATFLGKSPKAVRGLVFRRLIPFRKIGSRVMFVKSELEAWVRDLPGVSLNEARENVLRRMTG